MKITNRIVEETVSTVAGEDCLPLVRYLKDKKNVSEFLLAETIEFEINAVRNMLYRLYQNNLVSFTRKKDKQKGWYIYYWTFRPRMISTLIDKLKSERLDNLHSRLLREKGVHFYRCDDSCMRMDFDRAMDADYKCPECGRIMELEDNAHTITKIEGEIDVLKKEIAMREKMKIATATKLAAIKAPVKTVAKKKVVKKKVAKKTTKKK